MIDVAFVYPHKSIMNSSDTIPSSIDSFIHSFDHGRRNDPSFQGHFLFLIFCSFCVLYTTMSVMDGSGHDHSPRCLPNPNDDGDGDGDGDDDNDDDDDDDYDGAGHAW